EPLHVEVELAEAGGRAAERVDRGADVVAEAGKRELLGAHAAADRRLRFVDEDVESGARKGDRSGKTVRPGSDDDGATRRQAAPGRARPRGGTRARTPPRCSTRRAASRRGSARRAQAAAARAAGRRAPP